MMKMIIDLQGFSIFLLQSEDLYRNGCRTLDTYSSMVHEYFTHTMSVMQIVMVEQLPLLVMSYNVCDIQMCLNDFKVRFCSDKWLHLFEGTIKVLPETTVFAIVFLIAVILVSNYIQ